MHKQVVVEQAHLKPAKGVLAALLLVLLVCLGITARQFRATEFADFQVYDAAAEIVHEHHSIHMYDGADTGALFGLRFVDPGLPLAQAAQHLGIRRVRLYIYPPILADMVLPLTFVSGRVAGQLWLLLNLIALVFTALLMARILHLPWRGLGTLALLVGIFALFSTGMCLLWGQITILLLLLWTAGILCYQRGWHMASAFLFALATWIKLTPLLVVAPFLVWREWRWLRSYAVSLILLLLVICLVNTPASISDYFFHVMPSMSGGGRPDFENKSLLSSVQLLYVSFKGGNLKTVTMDTPRFVVTLGKACSGLVLLLAFSLVLRLGRFMRMGDRHLTLALFALLSVCVAPISWKHAYVVVFLVLAFLWADAFRRYTSRRDVLLLALCSLELGGFFFDSVAMKLTHGVLLGSLSFLAPGIGIAICLWKLAHMRPVEPASL